MNKLTRIVAHRAGAGLWPENSHCALEGVRAHAVDAVELDVHLTADDEIVVLHDATLDRLERLDRRLDELDAMLERLLEQAGAD